MPGFCSNSLTAAFLIVIRDLRKTNKKMSFQSSRISLQVLFYIFISIYIYFLRRYSVHQTFPQMDKKNSCRNPTTRFLTEGTKHQAPGKTLLPLCTSQGLRTRRSDAPASHGHHLAGDHQSDEQSPADHTDASAWDAHPYKLLLFRQHHLVPIFFPKNSEPSLGNWAGLGPTYTPALKRTSKSLVTTQ